MSLRIKRQLSKAGGSAEGGGGAPSAAARKKRRIDNSGSDDEERSVWTPKHLGDLRAYNRSASEAPAELFRKDLISAMKLADNEPLTSDDYWGIGDPWKQEWERGVQVPVNPDSLPEPTVTKMIDKPHRDRETNFRLTKEKFIRVTHDDFFTNEQHILSNLPTKAEKMCRYDMDDLDDKWLHAYNGERARMGAAPVPPLIFEMIIEHLEETCWENIHKMLKTEESLSIEFDEDVICDVCRSPDSEEGNEMVFCDSCNICVHQACYGITAIPSGSWLCRTCSLGIKPDCVLCPNKGGAMKSTKSGQKWAHVACALWIPEVSIGSVERMEPITKIPNIPQSRWALVCVLCRERRGACIQCSVKTCKTAYHVTCAFKHGLEMKAIIEDESADDGVKLRSYCEKHSVASKKVGSEVESEEGDDGTPKKKRDWTSEQKNQARAAKLRQIESEFYKHVDFLETSNYLDIDLETTETIYNYWKLKRRSGFNKPLLTPRSEEIDLLSQQQEHDIERMKMFVQLRQYLERVRNLCYMVNRRERLSRSFMKIREQTFAKQVAMINSMNISLSSQELNAVLQANHGPSVYDRLYSHSGAPVHTEKEFEKIIACIAGTLTEKTKKKNKKLHRKKDVNGLIRPPKDKSDNPYRKMYVNGAEQRRSRSSSMYSTSDSESSLASAKWTLPLKSKDRYSVYTSSEEETNKENHSIKVEPSSKIKNLLLDPSDKDKVKVEVQSRPTRGRVGRRRGGGRASAIKSRPFRDRVPASSDDDKDNKNFDALIPEKSIKTEVNASSSKTVRERPSVETSEDEGETAVKPKPQPTKRRNKKKVTPSKLDSSVSSEDESSVTPVKEKKLVRKGKWHKSVAGVHPANVNSPVSEPPKLELSDDDELLPPTYKLSSDEDNSEKSNDQAAVSSEVQGASDRTDISSDDGHSTALSKGPKKLEKKSDSDVNSEDDDNKESTTDSQSHAKLKTKAAKKEFTPKIEAKAERMNKKKTDKVSKVGKKSGVLERSKSETKQSEDIDHESPSIKNDLDPATTGHLFVPQRKAAKKASELITSQNTTSTSATAAATMPVPAPAETTTVEVKKATKQLKEVKDEDDDVDHVEEKKVPEEKKSTPTKGRRGKNKEKNDKEADDKADAQDTPKKSLFEQPEILPYVPMRQAARKAAENIKDGTRKVSTTASVPEEVEPAPAPAVSPTKAKRISRIEAKPTARSKSKSPRSGKAPSSTTVTDSESESEAETSSIVRKGSKDSKEPNQKQAKSIFSDSDDESSVKRIVSKDKPSALVEPMKEVKASTGRQFFRGDVFVKEYQSSSDEAESIYPTTPGKKTIPSPAHGHTDEKVQESSSKNQSFRGPSNVSGDLHLTSDSDERETENQKPAAGTLRKAPDKKLKTSEGRPEHGFQPPITERSESGVPKEAEDPVSKSPIRRESGLEPRLRQSGAQCRQRTPSGDIPLQDYTSNINASSSRGGRRRGREREPLSHSQNLSSSITKLPPRRTVQLEEEQVKPSKKAPEGGSQIKPTPTRGFAATSEKKEAVKEDLRDTREVQKDKKDTFREEDALSEKEPEKEKDSREKVLSSKDLSLLGEVKDTSKDISFEKEKIITREKVLSPRDKVVLHRDKVVPGKEKCILLKDKVPFAKEQVLSMKEREEISRVKDIQIEKEVANKEKQGTLDKDSLFEKRELRGKDTCDRLKPPLEETLESSRESIKPQQDKEPPVEDNKGRTCKEPSSRESVQHNVEKDLFRTMPVRLSEREPPPKETHEQLGISNKVDEQKKSGVFGYVDEDLKVERLEDIIETSDTEPEPKKVRIDSDDEPVTILNEKRVEQPKDSGYKSAITTPEPVDRLHPVCNDVGSVNSVVNSINIEESRLEADINKSLTVLPCPVEEEKQTLNKFISPARRKNLEDVIGEMKKQAEAQPEPSTTKPLEERASEIPVSPPPPPPPPVSAPAPAPAPAPGNQASSTSYSVPPPESLVPSSQTSMETIPPKSVASPAANFREQWRTQWGKSPPPPDHKVDPSSGTHLPMSGLVNPMLDLHQRPLYPDAQHQLYNAAFLETHPLLSSGIAHHQLSQLRQMMEAASNISQFYPLYLQQRSAPPDLAALSQQQFVPPIENQISEKGNMSTAQGLSRLPPLDDRPPTPDLQLTSSKTSNRQATPAAKTTKPLSSPSLPNTLAVPPPLSSPVASSNKVTSGIGSPQSSSRAQVTASTVSREEPPPPLPPVSPVLTQKVPPPQPSPSSILRKNDNVTATSQPSATSVTPPEVSPSGHSVLMSSASRSVVKPPQISPKSNKTQVPECVNSSDDDIIEVSEVASKAPRPVITTASSIVTTKMNIVPPISNSVVSVAKTITQTTVTSVNKSPLPAVTSPIQVDSPLRSATEVPDSKIETITVDDSVIHQKEEPVQKRVPIYMQDPKQRIPEKKSPRSQGTSPRWVKEGTKGRDKKSAKVGRGSYSKGRGRSAGRGKGRGQSPRFNNVSVPKELVGTVYDFDFDNEFDDDGPANNTLDDLRKSREKRQSVDTTPQQTSSTPTYIMEQHKEPSKKPGKKSKSHKEKGSSRSSDEVAKMLADYKNKQNSQLRLSVHSPSPPQEVSVLKGASKTPDQNQDIPQYSSEFITKSSDAKLIISESEARDHNQSSELSAKSNGDHGKGSLAVPTAQIIDEKTNQLKLKIKGPYANSYSTSNTSAPAQEVVGAPPTSTTSIFRQIRMRKKELIRQYCYQDQRPNELMESGPVNSNPNPPPHVRTGITIPKAVASMTSIPTREDYKMYTQGETTSGGSSGRRKRQPRESLQWELMVMDESGKRNSDASEGLDAVRKRPRSAKDSKIPEEKDICSAKPPPKLRISLGKKTSELTTVTDTKEMGGKQRPPKKRLSEENTLVKIKNDCMKFREQIMADFDKGGKKSGVKGTDREKKAKKRRVYLGESSHGSSVDSKDGSGNDKRDIKVIPGDSSSAPKLVIKFGKGKSESSNSDNVKSEPSLVSAISEEKSDPDSVPQIKIRLSLPKPDSDSSKDESCVPKQPLKLKLSRRSDGYVASNTQRREQPDVQDHGPGPPAPKPPDLPSETLHDKKIPNSAAPPPPSSPLRNHPEENANNLRDSQLSQPGIPAVPVSHPYNASPGLPGSLSAPDPFSISQLNEGIGRLGSLPRPEQPEEMLQKLEAQIATTRGSVSENEGPASSLGPRPMSGPPLPDVPSLHHSLYPYKEGSDCR
ncbi:LOW QUALITY PROTEIN: PHD finger protein rhinoceros [Macrobrachium rosenbergii]|uniref:LOW QUALITY PROTEIN: PHD finger protein rhinoceros n=1 Tax=Macrobrachium rosenbergii TaxID=79674 RepID=UPI0034D67A78